MTEPIDDLYELARNHRWTWHAPTHDLLARLPDFSDGDHPVAILDALAADQRTGFASDHAAEIAELADELRLLVAAAPPAEIAYFSPEFGVAAQVAQYSGGLGILAGDHLKAASDLGLPLVGVGLLYRQGFFRQSIAGAEQVERYEQIEPEAIGAVDTGLVVAVPVEGHDVVARVWKQTIGAVELVLLDTDCPANAPVHRAITDRLYSGDRRHRLDQELVLGVGGVRALRALGIAPGVFHLNEGHACFLLLELLAEQLAAGHTPSEAIANVRAATLFTTHTPVPAGIDRFDRKLIRPELARWATRLGLTVDLLFEWATLPTDGPTRPFNTAALAFELTGSANGVSQLHATVSRQLFETLPRAATLEGITNGVHARTWTDPALQQIYDRTLGAGWENGEAEAWSRVSELDADEFEAARSAGRRRLTDLVNDRTGAKIDPERPIIGFARRFATYKRAALILRDPDAMAATLDAGAQFVFAGKAHPADTDGKAVLAEIAAFADSSAGRNGLVLVPDYDIAIAQAMYAGCDVWLNNPIRPREASGTSGEKSALNGGLNCSVLDGWWADWYVDGIGWAIPTSDADDPGERDDAEASAIHELMLGEVLPTLADADRRWQMTVAMLGHLGPLVTAGRMVAEYDRRFYEPIRQR